MQDATTERIPDVREEDAASAEEKTESIEKPKRAKKPRSAKQQASFERARTRRLELIAAKKKQAKDDEIADYLARQGEAETDAKAEREAEASRVVVAPLQW